MDDDLDEEILGTIKQISDVQRRLRSIQSTASHATGNQDGHVSGCFLFTTQKIYFEIVTVCDNQSLKHPPQ